MARILIVDDDEADRMLVEAVLRRAGHETLAVEGGEAALRAYLDEGVDLVITDLQMPDVHGFELISILKEFVEPPVVIALSATGPVQLHMAEALGAEWTLSKPLDPRVLVDAVERTEREKRESRRRIGT